MTAMITVALFGEMDIPDDNMYERSVDSNGRLMEEQLFKAAKERAIPLFEGASDVGGGGRAEKDEAEYVYIYMRLIMANKYCIINEEPLVYYIVHHRDLRWPFPVAPEPLSRLLIAVSLIEVTRCKVDAADDIGYMTNTLCLAPELIENCIRVLVNRRTAPHDFIRRSANQLLNTS